MKFRETASHSIPAYRLNAAAVGDMSLSSLCGTGTPQGDLKRRFSLRSV